MNLKLNQLQGITINSNDLSIHGDESLKKIWVNRVKRQLAASRGWNVEDIAVDIVDYPQLTPEGALTGI